MFSPTTKTKAFSAAPQESGLKADPTRKLSAEQNPFGDKPIGDVLNELADPNWVDPNKVIRERKKDLDKDAFFKLMLTQMKHQDPTNPLQSHEMAAQLAQFTSLEQLFNINESLGELKKGQAPMADYQVLNFMGKAIAADSSKVVRNKGDKSHELRFDLVGDATSADIMIKDAEGKVVRKYTLQNLKAGTNKAIWNGMMEDNMPARAGDYQFVVEAKGPSGKKVHAATEIKGTITGVNYTPKGPVLLIGDQSIYLADVKKIEDPGLKDAAAKGSPAVPPQLLNGLGLTPPQGSGPGPKPKNFEEDVPGAPDSMAGMSNLDTVAMSSAIKDQLAKAAGQ